MKDNEYSEKLLKDMIDKLKAKKIINNIDDLIKKIDNHETEIRAAFEAIKK